MSGKCSKSDFFFNLFFDHIPENKKRAWQQLLSLMKNEILNTRSGIFFWHVVLEIVCFSLMKNLKWNGSISIYHTFLWITPKIEFKTIFCYFGFLYIFVLNVFRALMETFVANLKNWCKLCQSFVKIGPFLSCSPCKKKQIFYN